jgi:hypothetical protein
VVEAEPHKRVGQQAIPLDRVMALLTDAVCAVVHAIERRVHVLEELKQGGVLRVPHEGIFETTLTLLQLCLQKWIGDGGHVIVLGLKAYGKAEPTAIRMRQANLLAKRAPTPTIRFTHLSMRFIGNNRSIANWIAREKSGF